MEKTTNENNYNTNLASEYLIMSLLHRAGKEAYLTIGNKKSADIIVKTNSGAICVIEVKGVNKNLDWLIGNSGVLPSAPNKFYALVGYNGKIDDLSAPPKFYLIPSQLLDQAGQYKISKNGKTTYLSHKFIRENYSGFINTFKHLDDHLKTN